MTNRLKKLQRAFLWCFTTALTLSGAIFALYLSISGEMFGTEKFDIFLQIFPWLPHIFLLLLAVGIATLMLAGALQLWAIIPRQIQTYYTCLPGKDGDVIGAVQLAKRYIGEAVTKPETIKNWLSKNPSVLFSVRKHFAFRRGMVISFVRGYFVAVPLERDGAHAYLNCEISGTSIPLKWICSENAEPWAVYIGGIVGTDGISNQIALQKLKTNILSYIDGGVHLVIARGGTARGIEILKRFGFQFHCEDSNGPIYILRGRDLSEEMKKNIEVSHEHV